jgi:hypothetical protein
MAALSRGDDRDMAIASPIVRGVHLRSRIFMAGVIQTAFAKCEGVSFRADRAPQARGLNWSGDEFTA